MPAALVGVAVGAEVAEAVIELLSRGGMSSGLIKLGSTLEVAAAEAETEAVFVGAGVALTLALALGVAD